MRITKLGEDIFYDIFTKFSTKKVSPKPFRRIAYKDAMEMYGTDKPDLRNPLILQDVTDMFVGTEFKAFEDKHIIAIVVPGAGQETRKFFDNMSEFAVTECGAKGLAYLAINEDGSCIFVIPNQLYCKEDDCDTN